MNEERQQVYKELQECYTRLRTNEELSHVGSWTLSLSTEKGVWSNEMFRIHGRDYSLGTPTFEEFLLYVHPDDRRPLIEFQKHVIKTGRQEELYYRIIRPDKTILYMHGIVQCRYDADGNPIMLNGAVIDITEFKKTSDALNEITECLEDRIIERTKELSEANIRLKELDRLKSIFIASMSHELRTPLNSIIGFTGIILQGLVGDITDEQRKMLTIVKNSGNHLLTLINDVIDLSKIEADKIDIYTHKFDLTEVIKDVIESFSITSSSKGLRLYYNMPESLFIYSDERRVTQVITNLVSNALKFTDEGEVEVRVTHPPLPPLLPPPAMGEEFGRKIIAALLQGEGKSEKESMDTMFVPSPLRGEGQGEGEQRFPTPSSIEISVRDTGIGIKKEDMHKLFTAFSRINGIGQAKQEGTGLGLYLSKKLAKLLGGDIYAESEFGKGSRFVFVLPNKFPPLQGEGQGA